MEPISTDATLRRWIKRLSAYFGAGPVFAAYVMLFPGPDRTLGPDKIGEKNANKLL